MLNRVLLTTPSNAADPAPSARPSTPADSPSSAPSAPTPATIRPIPSAGVPRAELLWTTASNGNPEELNDLLKQGFDINATNEKGETAFHYAVKNRDYNAAKLLMERGADIDCVDKRKRTPLMRAAKNKDHFMVTRLLECGAKLNQVDEDGESALFLAAESGCVISVRALLKSGALANLKNSDGVTPLHYAASHGHYEIVDELCNAQAVLDFPDDKTLTPFLYAMSNGHVRVAEYLQQRGCNILHQALHQDINGYDAVMYAAASGNMLMLELVRAWGLDVVKVYPDGKTAVSLACEYGHCALMLRLIELGGKQPADSIFLAASGGHVDMLDLLLKEGSDVNSVNSLGQTLLHLAAKNGHMPMVQKLIKAGVDVMALDKEKKSALLTAAEYGHMAVVKELHIYEQIVNKKIKSALISTTENGCTGVEYVEELQQYEQITEAAKVQLKRALVTAVEKGHAPVVETILEFGCTPDWDSLQTAIGKQAAFRKWSDSIAMDLVMAELYPDHPDGWAKPKKIENAGADFIVAMIQAFWDGRRLQPRSIHNWLVKQGIRSANWKALITMLESVDKMRTFSLDAQAVSAVPHTLQIWCATLLATLGEPSRDFYEDEGLNPATVEEQTKCAAGQHVTLRAIGESILRKHCLSVLEDLTSHCLAATNLLTMSSNELASNLMEKAVLVSPVANRVASCWNRAMQRELSFQGSLRELPAFLQKEMPAHFAHEFRKVQSEDFYGEDDAKKQPEVFYQLLAIQLNFINQYCNSVAPRLDMRNVLDTV